MNFFKKGENHSKEEMRINKVLLLELKCVSCGKYMSEPIRHCAQGHSSCHDCVIGNACKRCGDTILLGQNRNLESFANKVKYPCKNSNEGCKAMFHKSELNRHEETCGFGKHPCLVSGSCEHSCLREKMVEHVTTTHNDQHVLAKSNVFLIENFIEKRNESFVKLVSAFNDVFWCHHSKNINENAAYWAIQYLGPDILCDNFTYNLKLHHPEDKDKYVGFKRVGCLKSGDSVSEAFAYLMCVKIKLDVAEKFTDKDGHVKCSIELKKNTCIQKNNKKLNK